MTLSGGYVKLFRSILDDPIFTQLTPSVLKIALYFLVRANYKPMKWYDGRTKVDIPKGSFIASYATIAKETKLSIKQVRGAMEHLSNLEFAAYTRATHWTLITITNYERYQSNETEEGTTEGTIGAGSGHNEGTMRAGQGQQEKEVKKGRSKEPKKESDPRFEKFYNEFWLPVQHADALVAFNSVIKSEKIYELMMAQVETEREDQLANEKNFRTKPGVWLRRRTWEDPQLPIPSTNGKYPHQPTAMKMPESGPYLDEVKVPKGYKHP